jgi:hypothetical protein
MGESLVSKSFIEELKVAPQQRLFPDVTILKIGGQSICDRGIRAIPGDHVPNPIKDFLKMHKNYIWSFLMQDTCTLSQD